MCLPVFLRSDRPKPTTGLTPLAVLAVEEPERPSRQQSPPRKPVSRIVHIINLVRPFTAGQLKQLLGRTGTLVEDGFWINSIKSHCYVTVGADAACLVLDVRSPGDGGWDVVWQRRFLQMCVECGGVSVTYVWCRSRRLTSLSTDDCHC